jgi:hypothetical protein
VTIGELRKLLKELREAPGAISLGSFMRVKDAVEELIALKEKPVDAIADAAAICEKRGL